MVTNYNFNNIVLIGFMGSGKSSCGRLLAKELNWYFLDSDDLIESFENRKIRTIFKDSGETYFREKEMECASFLSTNVKKSVISTGGGFPLFVKNIREIGKIIYLHVPFHTIIQRLNADELSKRPLFDDIDRAMELYEIRHEIYKKSSDIYIEADDEIERVVKKIVKKLSK